MRAMCFLIALAVSWLVPAAVSADDKADRERKVKVALALAAAKAKESPVASPAPTVAPMPRDKGCPVCPPASPAALPKPVKSHFIQAPAAPDRTGWLRAGDGRWLRPDPARPGSYLYAGEEPRAAPGVAAAPRPFPGPGPTAPSTPGTAAHGVITSRPPTSGAAPPRTTGLTASKGATPTAPTTTSAPGAAPAASSLAGSIEIGSGKLISSDWYDAQGNHFIRYADGSTKICSAYG
jgi:hypothetical protein